MAEGDSVSLRKGPSGPLAGDTGGGIQPPAGQIDGTTTDPLVVGITTNDNVELEIGTIVDGEFLKRSGTQVVSAQAGSNLQTGAALTSGNQTLATAQRYFMATNVAGATCIKTVTPPVSPFGFEFDIGVQANNVTLRNGGPNGGDFVVTAGLRQVVWGVSDGTDVTWGPVMPLASDPTS